MSAPTPPTWLPAAIPFTGDWETFVSALYSVFSRDFKGTWPRFRALPVWHDYRVLADGDGKEEAFWHLVTGDKWVLNPRTRKSEKERLPEFPRAERLPWAKPIVEHETDLAVLAWDYNDETKYGPVVRVSGHFKTGQRWPLQNQPLEGWVGDRTDLTGFKGKDA